MNVNTTYFYILWSFWSLAFLGFLFTQKENAFHVSTSFHEKLVSQQVFLNKFTKQDPRRISRKIFSNRIIYDEVNRKLDEEALLIITGNVSNDSEEKLIRNSSSVIYNRVNKCGSTSMLRLLEDLGFRNNFALAGLGMPKLRSFKELDKATFARFLCSENNPRMVFSRHLYFVDWSEFGCDIPYFNLIRDPVERFISRYYFHRRNFIKFHSNNDLKDSIRKQLYRSVDECVIGNHTECLYSGIMATGDYTDYRVHSLENLDLDAFSENYSFRMDSQIPFFCGDSIDCRTIGSDEALKMAITNINTKFVTVGLLEEFDKSLIVMECKLNSFLKGLPARQKYTQHHENKNTQQKRVSEQTRDILRARLKHEYILYEYVRTRLDTQYRHCRIAGRGHATIDR